MNGISLMLDIPTIEHTNTNIKHTSVEKDYNNNSVYIACGCCNSSWIYSNKATKK